MFVSGLAAARCCLDPLIPHATNGRAVFNHYHHNRSLPRLLSLRPSTNAQILGLIGWRPGTYIHAIPQTKEMYVSAPSIADVVHNVDNVHPLMWVHSIGTVPNREPHGAQPEQAARSRN